MSTIVQQPDSLSFSGNLKTFEINSVLEVVFKLWQGATLIVSEKYAPDQAGHVSINVSTIVDRLLSVSIPANNNIINEQTTGAIDFTATVDAGANIVFRVVKGGVFELQGLASSFLAGNFLTWQPQEKLILQSAPEWLGIYPISAGTLRLKAYYANATTYTGNYAALSAGKLYSINTSWGIVSAWLLGLAQSTQVVAWDVWYEVAAVRTTPIQRYQLRNAGSEEHQFVWVNTLSGIDSRSFTGASEDDQKLDHKLALYDNETISEYDIEKLREVKQSTGYLNSLESDWLKDFFVSRKKYVVRADGSLKQIAVVSSKVITVSLNDEVDYEFTYRLSTDSPLLNLNRTLSELAAPEGLSGFFLAELLSGLTEALYADNLLLAVQSPFVQGWQKLSFAQLWGSALPRLVDGTTIQFFDGKLRTQLGVVNESRKPKHGLEAATDATLFFQDSTREFSITGIGFHVWNRGELLLKNTEKIVLTNTSGLWYIYYHDVPGVGSVLTATQTSWNRNLDLPIATVNWNGATGVLKDNRYVYTEVNHSPLTRFEDKPHPADDIYTDTSKFLNLLTVYEKTVQLALEKLDYHLKVTKIEFLNTSTPKINNYNVLYAPIYGQTPNVRMFVTVDANNGYESRINPVFTYVGGLIDTVFFEFGAIISGFLIISR